MVKRSLLICLSLLTFLTFPKLIYSVSNNAPKEDFAASFDVNYHVGEDGLTQVTQQITLTNLTTNLYAKEYNLSIGSTKINNIEARDSLGTIDTKVTKNEKSTAINLTFNDRVVGKDKTLKFSLNYQVSNVATKVGQMWEVTLPKLQISADIKSYNLHLFIPEDFGEIHYLSPTPIEVKDSNPRLFSFSQDQLEKSGVVAAFGKFQLYDFELKYHLLNKNIFNATAQISLPPDTNSQEVIFDSLDPKPDKLETDLDGNYLATYGLSANQRLDVVARGNIKLVEPNNHNLQKLPIDKASLKKFLSGNQYWNLDPEIKDKANQLTSKSKTSDEKAKALYDYISTTLTYDYNRLKANKIDRLGALGALNNPTQALCTEYTDLFIAMARAVGIPSREIDGYATTNDKDLRPTAIGGKIASDILHAWPQYYSTEKEAWIQIDPTWASTTGGVDYFNKLDADHIVFVIKGVSADEPYPAGVYKIDASASGDVSIKPTTIIRDEKPAIEVKLKETAFASGFTNNLVLLVKNNGKRALFAGDITVDKVVVDQVNPTVLNFGTILPSATLSLNFKVRSSSLFSASNLGFKAILTGSDGNNQITKKVNQTVLLKPFFTQGWLPIFFGGLLIAILSFVFFLLRKEIKTFRLKDR